MTEKCCVVRDTVTEGAKNLSHSVAASAGHDVYGVYTHYTTDRLSRMHCDSVT